MTFQDPERLWWAVLLGVPLVLYWCKMPRRRVATGALFLWERFLRAERFGRTSQRFRRVLGLALFVGVLVSLILAAADLTLGRSAVQARNLVVLVDTSASMNAVTEGRSNLDRAREAASRLIESLDAGTHVALAEVHGELRVIALPGPAPPGRSPATPWRSPAGRDAARGVRQIQPSDAPGDLGRALKEAFRLWGQAEDTEAYAFTDADLPAGPWGKRAHAWIAPPAGDNAAVTAFRTERRGPDIVTRFTLANYGARRRTVRATVLVNGLPRRSLDDIRLGPGESVERSVRLPEPGPAAVQVKLDADDVLRADDEARAVVPSLDDLRVRLVEPRANRRAPYVRAVLSALREEGVIGPVSRAPIPAAATVYVNRFPEAWPEGGAIVLYPLRSGVVEVAGLVREPVAVTRQASGPLLRDVDLRGLTVKGAVRTSPPDWAQPLVWAGDLPLVWAGEARARRPDEQGGGTKVLFVGMPVVPSGSRLPLVAAFPVLMRNALLWMLPSPKALRPGDRVAGWTSRQVGFVESPVDGAVHAFSVMSPAESDLRPDNAGGGRAADSPGPAGRHSLALALLAGAVVLLGVEWALFHKRLTE